MLGSVAFAQWLAEGEGNGRAEAGVAEDLVVTEAAPSDAMHPGGTAAVALTVHNPNPYPVTVTLVEQVPGEDITSDTAGCDASNHGVTFSSQTTSIGIAAGGSTTAQLPDAAAMSLDAADACQGAIFSIPLRVTGAAGNGGAATSTWYADTDSDGYGGPGTTVSATTQPTGYVDNSSDCDDSNASIHPGATEIAGDGIDNDCDGQYAHFEDADADGFGSTNVIQSFAASPSEGLVDNSSDCDDSNASIHPGTTEIAGDGVDNDCDGQYTHFQDADADGFGSTTTVESSSATASAPEGTSDTSDDCDDGDESVYPGAPEVVDDKDNDCDGVVDEGT